MIETKHKDPFARFLGSIVGFSVRILAVLMVFVVFWAMVDVVVHIYNEFLASYGEVFSSESIFESLGSVLVVLIAIEIFLNIIYFLVEDTIHVPLVLATALTAISRKVIIIDYTAVSAGHMYATAALIAAVGLVYWLVSSKHQIKIMGD